MDVLSGTGDRPDGMLSHAGGATDTGRLVIEVCVANGAGAVCARASSRGADRRASTLRRRLSSGLS